MKKEISWVDNEDMVYKMYSLFLVQKYDVNTDTFFYNDNPVAWGGGKKEYKNLINFMAKYSDAFKAKLKADGISL